MPGSVARLLADLSAGAKATAQVRREAAVVNDSSEFPFLMKHLEVKSFKVVVLHPYLRQGKGGSAFSPHELVRRPCVRSMVRSGLPSATHWAFAVQVFANYVPVLLHDS